MKTLKAILLVCGIAYPLAVFYFLNLGYEPRLLTLLLVILLLGQFLSGKEKALKYSLIAILSALSLVLWFSNSQLFLRFYPVIMIISMLAVFSYSLVFPPTMVERIAKMKEPYLPEAGVRYCRNVTIAWCVFFSANAAIAACTVAMTLEIWTLYNGLISYIIMGALFAGEYAFRKARIRHAGKRRDVL